jgi:hypothetical protein
VTALVIGGVIRKAGGGDIVAHAPPAAGASSPRAVIMRSVDDHKLETG